jgi:hypothetical protein
MRRTLATSLFRSGLPFVALLICAPVFEACSPGPGPGGGGGGGEGGGGGGGEGEGEGEGECPAGNSGGLSVCQLQNPNATGRPSEGGEVNLRAVAALTDVFNLNAAGTIKALFVSDVPLKPYGGVLVTFGSSDGFSATKGEVLDVTGTLQEFSSGGQGSETRVLASFIQSRGTTVEIQPLLIADPAVLADETLGEAYEGVLVRVSDVTVTDASLGFGQFQVTGGLVTDDTIFGYSALEGEVLGSLTGVMGYNAFADGGFRLLPRDEADVVSVSKPSVTIPQLRDPSRADHRAPCPTNSFECPLLQLSNVVVTTDAYYLSTSGTSGNLFGFFVADPAAVDADGRLLPYSGILVTISPQRDDVDSDYSFAWENENRRFASLDAAPRIGDVVTLTARNGVYFGMSQLYQTARLERVGTTATVAGVEMPLPARFDGSLPVGDARHPSRLKTGRPAVTVEQGGVARAAETGDDATESFEGMLVELVNVETTSACEGYPFSNNVTPHLRDFGYFRVTGGVEVGELFFLEQRFGGFWFTTPGSSPDRVCALTAEKCEDSRQVGQQFGSLTGVINYSFDVHRLNPRRVADIQPPSLFVAQRTPAESCPTN